MEDGRRNSQSATPPARSSLSRSTEARRIRQTHATQSVLQLTNPRAKTLLMDVTNLHNHGPVTKPLWPRHRCQAARRPRTRSTAATCHTTRPQHGVTLGISPIPTDTNHAPVPTEDACRLHYNDDDTAIELREARQETPGRPCSSFAHHTQPILLPTTMLTCENDEADGEEILLTESPRKQSGHEVHVSSTGLHLVTQI